MLKVKLYNFKTDEIIDFQCLAYEIEKGFYKFYMKKTTIKYIPSYEWIVDIKYPFEVWQESSQQDK